MPVLIACIRYAHSACTVGTDAMIVHGGLAALADSASAAVMLRDVWVLNLATYVAVGLGPGAACQRAYGY